MLIPLLLIPIDLSIAISLFLEYILDNIVLNIFSIEITDINTTKEYAIIGLIISWLSFDIFSLYVFIPVIGISFRAFVLFILFIAASNSNILSVSIKTC